MRLALAIYAIYLRPKRPSRKEQALARADAIRAAISTIETLLYISECLTATSLALARQSLEDAVASKDPLRIQSAADAVYLQELEAFAKFRARWEVHKALHPPTRRPGLLSDSGS